MRRSIGHIRSNGDNSYSIKISLPKDSTTGKYRAKWFTIRGSRKDAEKRLSELLHQLDTGTFMQTSKTTVAEYFKRWLADYVKPNLSPRTFEGYASIITQHLIPSFGNIPLTQLRGSHLQKYYADKVTNGRCDGKGGLSNQSVRHHHMVLHKALQIAVKWGLVVRNVADGIDIPRARHIEMQTWDEAELNKFLEAAKSTPYYALFYTALFTGMRRSELLALRWQDIDLIYSQIYVNLSMHQIKDGSFIFTAPKTDKSRRTIALTPSTFLVLESYRKAREVECKMLGVTLQDGDLVFSTLGKPLRPNTITRAWGILASKAGVKVIRLHDARHTHASLMLKQGIHPKFVQERLGHSTISITLDTYSHVAPGLQEAAAKRFDDAVQIKHNDNVSEDI
jgi:integrase